MKSSTGDTSPISTGIRGLDFLLHGGIKCQGDFAPTLLIHGPPGSGKTTLGAGIAIGASRLLKRPSLVFLIEEEPGTFKTHLRDVQALEETGILDASKYVKGNAIDADLRLVIASLPTADFATCFTFLAEQIELLAGGAACGFAAILLDGLGALGPLERDRFLQMCRSCQPHASMVIATADDLRADSPGANDLAYASDIVLHLDYAQLRADSEPYFIRFLEVEKCRHQQHYRGRHRCSIFPSDFSVGKESFKHEYAPHGFEVFPSASSRLSSYVETSPRRDYTRRIAFGVKGLDALLGSSRNTVGGMVSGSTCLLIGERATAKFELALHFVAEGLRQDERCLVITFRRDADMVQAIASGYENLVDIAQLLLPANSGESFHFHALRPSHMDAGQFLAYLSHILEGEGPAGQFKYQRVVIDDLSALQHGFPLLAGDPLFLPALVQYISCLDCTTIFTDTIEEASRDLQGVHSRLLDTVDYIVVAQHLVFSGRDHTVLNIRRSPDGTHDTTAANVERARSGAGNVISVDSTAFLGLTGILDKKPESVDVFIRLAYENKAQQAFNESLKERVQGGQHKNQVVVSNVPWSHIDRSDLSRLRRFTPESPLSAVRAISLDTYWVRWAAEAGLLEDLTENIQNDYSEIHLPAALDPCHVTINGRRGLYALPHYLDIGLFCTRAVHEVREGESPVTVPLSWDMLSKYGTDGQVLLAFDTECDESLVCALIEFVVNSGRYNPKCRDTSSGDMTTMQCDWQSFATIAIDILGRLRGLVVDKKLPFPCTLSHYQEATFVRSWYSSLRKAYEDVRDTEEERKPNSRYIHTRFPTLGTKAKLPTYICSGAWYLGLLSGSIWPMIGAEILRHMTSTNANIQRAKESAGIPAVRGFYDLYRGVSLGGASHEGPIVENLTYAEIERAFDRKSDDIHIIYREGALGVPVAAFAEVAFPLARQIRAALSGYATPENAVAEMGRLIENSSKSRKQPVTS